MRPSLLAVFSFAFVACTGSDGPSVDDTSIDDTDPVQQDSDGDGFSPSEGDCDDTDALVSPGAAEECDEIDNDCDMEIDEGFVTTWYADIDADSYGDDASGITSCTSPFGFVAVAGDCDDAAPLVHPGADESDCADPTDYDCDGTTAYLDADSDGTAECEDCDDTSADVHPGAIEMCNGVDDNCDEAIDDPSAGDAGTWYADSDGDGYGALGVTTAACDEPGGYVADATDCDDASATVSPVGVESCNTLDDNCDGSVDEDACTSCVLTSVGTPTSLVSSGTTHGNWFVDPLETLGEGLVWEMDGYSGSVLVEYANQAAMVARTATSSTRLPYTSEGTGAVMYDGYLYYHYAYTSNIVKYDITSGEASLLELPGAGSHNTYAYLWGGYSDVDLAVDEQGLWALYSTASNRGLLVVSKIDEERFTITDTWNTSSPAKNTLGNAWMMCGVLYTTDDYYISPTTVNYAFDTFDERTWVPDVSFSNPHNYNSSINYNSADGLLRSWDSSYRQTYTTTVE